MITAYHFVGGTLLDGRPIPADGEWLTHEGEAVLCKSGLHASKCPFDALAYAPGQTLCLVECDDVVAEEDNKFVCRRRKIVARFDATEMLFAFARWAALGVIDLWNAPDVVRKFLETGDESLRAAARAAARAARGPARDPAWAARAAAWDAAADAAADAARTAAWDAAWAVAWATTVDRTAAWDAAADAAAEAAADAKRAEQRAHFKACVDEQFAASGH
ncbi:MAG TPA: hypothetical protein VGI14_04915 [Casimicrobiaceae bacterium]